MRRILPRLALLALLMPTIAAADKPTEAAFESLDLRLRETAVGTTLALPQFRVYDAAGRLVMDYEGYSSEFPFALEAVLDAPQPLDSPRHLEFELATLEGPQGEPLPELPEADLVLVKYSAVWCIPCHAMARDLDQVLATERDLKVLVLNVSADHIEL